MKLKHSEFCWTSSSSSPSVLSNLALVIGEMPWWISTRLSPGQRHDHLARPGLGISWDLLGLVHHTASVVKITTWAYLQSHTHSHLYSRSCVCIIEGSLEVKLPTIWTDEKQSRAEAERRERSEERRSEKRKIQKKADADAWKGRKVAKHCVFPTICGSGGSKSRLAKAAGAEPAGQMSKKCTPLWREAHFEVKMYKTHHGSDHFWKLRCRKSARRCGAKHILKSTCTKHSTFGPLLEVEMSKKCTPLWREAHFQVKMYKAQRVRDHFWRFRCRFAWQAQGIAHLFKSEQNVRVL